MARIGIATTGLTGIRNATGELARRLRAAGHRVTTLAPRPGADVRLPEIDLRPERAAAAGATELLAAYRPEGFVRAVRDGGYDLLLLDVELHEYILASHGHGFPFALLSQWYSHWRSPGLPYPLTEVSPGQGWAGSRAGLWLTWERVRWQRRLMFARRARRTGGRDRRSLLLRLAREYAFPERYLGDSFWPGAFAYRELPALTMTPREMDFPHTLRPNLHYLGPMVNAGREEARVANHRGVDAGAVLREARAADQRIICGTVSTLSPTAAGFLRRLARAVADRPDWCLLLGTGAALRPAELGAVAPNVHLFTYLPQLRVLAVADLSINHGGIHTIHEALHFRVPMLVYSGKQSDQPGCAARVAYHGVGARADRDADGWADIRDRIAGVLEDTTIRAATERMGQRLDRYRDERIAERTVGSLLRALS